MRVNAPHGRAQTVLVLNQGQRPVALRSEVIATVRSSQVFGFNVTVGDSRSYNKLIAGLLQELAAFLNLGPVRIDVEFVALDALGVLETPMGITGGSADVSVLFASVSALLQMPCRKDVLLSGAIVTSGGDIGAVRDMPAKLEAFASDRLLSRFVCPLVDGDGSVEKLLPQEFCSTRALGKKANYEKRLHPVRSVQEVWSYLFEERVLLAAAYRQSQAIHPDTLAPWVCPLFENLKKRFWNELRRLLHGNQVREANELLSVFIDYYIKRGEYPTPFGLALGEVLQSLPIGVKRLLPLESLICTAQLDALERLAESLGISDPYLATLPQALLTATKQDSSTVEDCFGTLLERLCESHLTAAVDAPIDEARSQYRLTSLRVTCASEFWQEIESFLAHVSTARTGQIVEASAFAQDAVALVDEVYRREGGVAYALSIAMARGSGMRRILDELSEAQKLSARRAYVRYVFARLCEAQDFEFRVQLTSRLMTHFHAQLPPEVSGQPPERYAREFEALLEVILSRSFYLTL